LLSEPSSESRRLLFFGKQLTSQHDAHHPKHSFKKCRNLSSTAMQGTSWAERTAKGVKGTQYALQSAVLISGQRPLLGESGDVTAHFGIDRVTINTILVV
jgi:hypothetical protein